MWRHTVYCVRVYCRLCCGKVSHTKKLMWLIRVKLLHGRHTVAVAETLILIFNGGWLIEDRWKIPPVAVLGRYRLITVAVIL